MPVAEPDRSTSNSLTRRSLVQVGAAGAATIWLGKLGGLEGKAQAATGGDALRRSTYLSLASADFKVTADGRAHSLELVGVEDLPIASRVPSLRNSDEAFSLRFRGAAGNSFGQGIHQLSHQQLGTSSLFIAPIEKPGNHQDYEILVDRTVKIPGLDETGAPAAADPSARGSSESSRRAVGQRAVPRLVRASLRSSNSGKKLLADVQLANAAAIGSVRATLTRRGKVVAGASAGSKRGHSLLRFGIRPPQRGGRYELLLTAIDRDGHVTSLRKQVRFG